MAIQGTLKTMSLTDLLQFLAAGRKTGTLKFVHNKTNKQVYFENGLIVGSKSNDPREYLGQTLLHYGKLTEAQLQAVREAQRGSSAKLGEILVQRGFMTEVEVLDILRTRTLEAIYDLFLWTDGEFQFYDDEPLPDDLILIQLEPTNVIMEGIYRLDELARYRTLVPSDRAILVLGPAWTSSLKLSKEMLQILSFVEKKMSVAEICYNVHASAFHVYGQLYELISKGFVRVTGELPDNAVKTISHIEDVPESTSEMIWSAEQKLEENPDEALTLVQRVLLLEPNNAEAQALLQTAESRYIRHVFETEFSGEAIPRLLVSTKNLVDLQIEPQEAFVLSRINGEWDVQSILSICPFRDADCLRMIRKLLARGIIGL